MWADDRPSNLPPMTPPSWRLKLERARAHMRSLDRQTRTFERRKENTIGFVFKPTAKPGEWFGEVTSVPEQPPRWALVVGDAIHNYRSALDHIFWALPRVGGQKAHNMAQFPIATKWEQWTGPTTTKSLLQLDSEIIGILDWVQPYHRPNPDFLPLAHLSRLDNHDKHRTVELMRLSAARIEVRHRDGITYAPGIEYEAFANVPLKVGHKLVHVTISGLGHPQDYVECHLQVDIAFTNGLGVHEMMQDFDEAVTGMFALLEPYL